MKRKFIIIFCSLLVFKLNCANLAEKIRVEELDTIKEIRNSEKYNSLSSRECAGWSLIAESKSGLRLMKEPKLDAEEITIIPYKNTVWLIEDTKIPVSIGNHKGTFFKVEYIGIDTPKIGYVFSEYFLYNKINDRVCGYKSKEEKVDYYYTPGNYFIALTNSAMDRGFTCNTMYGSVYCFYLVYNSKKELILDSRDISTRQRPWKGWYNRDEIEIDESFGDDGCSYTKRYVLDIKTRNTRTLEESRKCTSYMR